MKNILNSNSFSIIATNDSVEIIAGKVHKDDAQLICFCRNFQSAIRIGQTAAQIYNKSLIVLCCENLFQEPLTSPYQKHLEVHYEVV